MVNISVLSVNFDVLIIIGHFEVIYNIDIDCVDFIIFALSNKYCLTGQGH